MNRHDEARLVYNSELGRLCPGCGQAIKQCRCHKNDVVVGDGIVRLSYETKGRKGKGVTVITGIPVVNEEIKDVAKKLKKLCGSGGAVKQQAVEIQGDHRQRLLVWLQKQGWKVKQVGG
ncbi:MAG: translation initiation factor Sui1 [Desulfuromonas sp.]|nr:translation initiation factor Sui1 [Desulfuromonas sp.]